jgi:hypothetical protein
MLSEKFGMNPHAIAELFGVYRDTVISNLKSAKARREAGITLASGRHCPKCGTLRVMVVWGGKPRVNCPTCQWNRDRRKKGRKRPDRQDITVTNKGNWAGAKELQEQSNRAIAALNQRRALRLSQLPESELRFVRTW